MTRGEAIRLLDGKTSFEALTEIEYYNGFNGLEAQQEAISEACVLAVAALREQEERSKGCEYCDKYDDPCGVPMIATEEDECDRGIYLYNGWICSNGGSFCEAKVKFCPMCGRKLEVEG